MKIALVLSSPPGYSETFFKSKIKGLQAQGHKVVLITAATPERFSGCEHRAHPTVSKSVWVQLVRLLWVGMSLLPYLGRVLRYIRLERKSGTSLKRTIEKTYLNATLLKLKADWLHFGFATMAIDRELVAKAIGAKMAVSFRGYDINIYPLKHPDAYQLLWHQVDKVHSISKYLLNKAYTLGLPKETPYQIITPAVTIEKVPKRDALKNNIPIKITTVARLHYIKGIDLLLETASLLRNQHIDFVWEVIGAGTKKDTERYLYHRYELGLEEKVVFTGKKTHRETLRAMAGSDIYVQTSLTEGFCNAVLEAQAIGVPVIASNTGGMSENIIHDKTGWTVPELVPELFAAQIESVLALPATAQKRITAQAAARVEREFSIEKQQREFVGFYSSK
ncbi:glycosyltransferase family 4 protein [Marixanthomonas spongiae]|uniref:Glycosyltransferase n=1 Tax=Marixanthomonas spongiae TaxID=2174845 RepID=A0A2U0I5T2_9FLAO|nr:glycosyltransferase family 4 protein [Marixanthomonas spongiae]PVW16467.1 glycosyltransferase [Marixanthomonas spongiae]